MEIFGIRPVDVGPERWQELLPALACFGVVDLAHTSLSGLDYRDGAARVVH